MQTMIGEIGSSINRTTREQDYKDNQCPKEFYEWSELKSSYFVKNIIKNDGYNRVLVNRMRTHAKYMCQMCNIDFQTSISSYLRSVNTDGRKDDSNPYPVAQIHQFKNEPNERLLDDFYALYNFNKFLFVYCIGKDVFDYHLNNGISLRVDLIVFRYYYDMIQQKIFRIQQSVRGDRYDVPNVPEWEKSDILGISNNRYNDDNIDDNSEVYIDSNGKGATVLKTKQFPNKRVITWQHPGINSCRPYFNGKYGENIKKYMSNNQNTDNFFSSFQCGISASTNYIVFPFLFSTVLPNNIEDIKNILEDIIIMSVLGLCGDGGHNLREVLSGIVTTLELCKIMTYIFLGQVISPGGDSDTLLDKLKTTLNINDVEFNRIMTTSTINNFANSIYRTISNDTKTMTTNAIATVPIFKEFTRKIYFLHQFCIIGVDITKKVNITGITTKDLILTYNMSGNLFTDYIANQKRNELLQWFIVNVMMRPYNTRPEFFNETNINKLQILLALVSDRYKQDNFKKGVTEFFNDLLTRRSYNEIIQNINDELDVIVDENCYFEIDSERTEDIGLMKPVKIMYKINSECIPYA